MRFSVAMGPRQIDLNRCPFPQPAANADSPAGLTHNAEHHRQAKPSPVADFLGREERLERALDDLGGHSGSGVAQGDKYAIPTGDLFRQLPVHG